MTLTSSPSVFHKRAAPAVGRRVSSPVPASAASSASSTNATPPCLYASDDSDFNDADSAQYRVFLSMLARRDGESARRAIEQAGATAALGGVSFPWAEAGITCIHGGNVRTATASLSPCPVHQAVLNIPESCGPGFECDSRCMWR